jgi:hypothetical protein
MLHVCVRRALAWHDEAAVEATLDDSLRPKVALWNATFDLSYARFRLRLWEITRRNLAAVENAKLARVEDVPPGAWLVPLDDDDWLAPQLTSRLAPELDPHLLGLTWDRYILELPRHLRRFPWPRRRSPVDSSSYTCGSNNYALRRLPELADGIRSHVRASELFDASPARVRHVPASLSLQNRNLASRSALRFGRQALTREELVRRLRRHRRFYAGVRLPPELAWAVPCVDAMAELMHAIRVR